jgi:protein phosphatase
MVDDDELCQIMADSNDLVETCRQLINTANEHGGEDNVTAVLIRMEDISMDEMRATIPDMSSQT